MAGTGDSPSVPLGAIAALGILAAAAIWTERQKTAAERAASQPDEVALHQCALAAVEQARAQIYLARRYAEQLRHCSVDFDVQAKLASAFDEELPPQAKPGKGSRRAMLFMVDGQERLPALKEAVEQFLPTPLDNRVDSDEPPSTRSILRHIIDAEGGIWSASKALAALQERGWHSDSDRPLNVVGNTLAVMARDGEITRAERGMYASTRPLVSPDTEQEVVKEASPGVWVITGLDAGGGAGEDGDAV